MRQDVRAEFISASKSVCAYCYNSRYDDSCQIVFFLATSKKF